jgi:hypothetical protein
MSKHVAVSLPVLILDRLPLGRIRDICSAGHVLIEPGGAVRMALEPTGRSCIDRAVGS